MAISRSASRQEHEVLVLRPKDAAQPTEINMAAAENSNFVTNMQIMN
jgi:hypothetical protein